MQTIGARSQEPGVRIFLTLCVNVRNIPLSEIKPDALLSSLARSAKPFWLLDSGSWLPRNFPCPLHYYQKTLNSYKKNRIYHGTGIWYTEKLEILNFKLGKDRRQMTDDR